MNFEKGRATFNHYNEQGEWIGCTNDSGERYTVNSNGPSGDKRWPLFRRYIQPFLRYQDQMEK
jgi:hypothetical protein